MKALFDEFNNYPLAVQKAICQRAFYDKYRHNRVIVKKGQEPDGIYFVLSGLLMEKHDIGRQPKEIQTGAMFGENDLVCGSRRRHTVLTRNDTELLYLHKQDYRVIFNMADDSNDPKNLDICKQHIVFQHFPMVRLVDNPGTWSVIKYKYGRLIAKDNNDVDWIYVIKSGEAKVYKYLEPGEIDVQERRRKVQAMKNAQSSFHRTKKILNFVEEREYIKSSYSPRKYHPTTRPTMSAPPGALRNRMLMDTTRRDVSTCIPGARPARADRYSIFSLDNNERWAGRDSKRSSVFSRQSVNSSRNGSRKNGVNKDTIKLPKLKLDEISDDEAVNANGANENEKPNGNEEGGEGGDEKNNEESSKFASQEIVIETIQDVGNISQRNGGLLSSRNGGDAGEIGNKTANSLNVRRMSRRPSLSADAAGNLQSQASVAVSQTKDRTRTRSFLKTPQSGTARSLNSQKSPTPQVIRVGNHTLPAFVQVETLHPGQVFGLRSCLDPEERGPSVSLVSGECEVLQINKKFFMKHCDDAIYSLIRLKAKPWPSQEDLIDRLDVNMQWEEYKQQTLNDFLQRCRRFER